MRVLVVDDNVVARTGVGSMVKMADPAHFVVLARNGAEAVDLARRTPFDIAFLDVAMPGLDGVKVGEEIGGEVPCVMITNREDYGTVKRALAAGARGYLAFSGISLDDIKAALLVVPKGGMVMGKVAVAAGEPYSGVFRGGNPEARRRFGISDREAEVLNAAARGLSTQQIADELGITPGTAQLHISNINRKMGVVSRNEAVAIWTGIVEP
jgi:DNA-binding NarL/FixJ family response regulator